MKARLNLELPDKIANHRLIKQVLASFIYVEWIMQAIDPPKNLSAKNLRILHSTRFLGFLLVHTHTKRCMH